MSNGIYTDELLTDDLDINAFLIANYCKYYFDIDAVSETCLYQIEFVTNKGSLIITKDMLNNGTFQQFKQLIGIHYKVVHPHISLSNNIVADRNKDFAPAIVYVD